MIFKTEKGTEIPLLNLKGKSYLQVAHRVLWFREIHPDWQISTDIVDMGPDHCVAKAFIRNAEGFLIADAYKKEDRQGFGDFIEKATTGAVGRALALCGFGTQFTSEFDEGERVVDAPRETSSPPKEDVPWPEQEVAPQVSPKELWEQAKSKPVAPSQESYRGLTFHFGKLKGKPVTEADDGYISWMIKGLENPDRKYPLKQNDKDLLAALYAEREHRKTSTQGHGIDLNEEIPF